MLNSVIDERFYLEIFVNHQVFVLDVAMGDSMTIQVMDGFHYLTKDIPSLVLRQTFMRRLFYTLKEIVRRTWRVARAWRGRGRMIFFVLLLVR